MQVELCDRCDRRIDIENPAESVVTTSSMYGRLDRRICAVCRQAEEEVILITVLCRESDGTPYSYVLDSTHRAVEVTEGQALALCDYQWRYLSRESAGVDQYYGYSPEGEPLYRSRGER